MNIVPSLKKDQYTFRTERKKIKNKKIKNKKVRKSKKRVKSETKAKGVPPKSEKEKSNER